MCFRIPAGQTRRTANKDIICYKMGYLRPGGTFSPYFNASFNYRFGEVRKLFHEKWPVESEDNPREIRIGFHSYSNKKKLMGKTLVDRVKCIIPKGAHYFYNSEDKEYVSDQIVVQELID